LSATSSPWLRGSSSAVLPLPRSQRERSGAYEPRTIVFEAKAIDGIVTPGAESISHLSAKPHNETFLPGNRTCCGGAYKFQISGALAAQDNVAIPLKA
jgi:hypothetical protein